MAPEQFRGEPVDIRADLYALGVTVYELLTGSRPYRNPLDTNVHPLTELDPEISPHLAEVVHRALSKAPAQRFDSPMDMRSALEPFRQPAIRLSIPPHTGPQAGLWTSANEVAKVEAPPAAAPARPPRRKFRTLVALACLAVVVLTATTAGALAFGRGDDGPEPTPSPLALPTVGSLPTVQPTPVTVAQSTAIPTLPPAPTSSPTPNAADAWQATLTRLDAVWQTDWPTSIAILDSYLQQYPDQQAAIDKLYAALVEYGGELIESGSTNDGIAPLERARALAPGRQEAQDALLALTPTAASRATAPAGAAADVDDGALSNRGSRRDRNARVGACNRATVGNSRPFSDARCPQQERLEDVAPTATPHSLRHQLRRSSQRM